jgi:hypothetical protein
MPNSGGAVDEMPARAAVGIESVLQSLDEGRVKVLFLGTIQNGETVECGRCGKWHSKGKLMRALCKSEASAGSDR